MNSTAFICTTCGVQYPPSGQPPGYCPICTDDRQYIGPGGQQWTTLEKVARQHRNVFEWVMEGVWALYSTPCFGIGQRAHLVQTSSGNILWDCITNLDTSTRLLVESLGGLQAIAISHPHYLSTVTEWSEAFGNIPVYIHAADRQWLGRSNDQVVLWEGEQLDLFGGLQVVRCGGHFPGASVLFAPIGKGVLFTGDTIQVAPDGKTVSFMYSYPNLIPLPAGAIDRICGSVAHLSFDALYGAFGRYIPYGAEEALRFSADRYRKAIGHG